MCEIATDSLNKAFELFEAYDEKKAEAIRTAEDQADVYEDEIGSYLVKLSARDLSETESLDVTKLLHMIGDFERLSDHAVNLMESVVELQDKNVTFSEYAAKELAIMRNAVSQILTIAQDAFVNSDLDKALMVEPLEQVVDELHDQIKFRHTLRLQKNICSIELGFILSDVLTNLERVSDHCSNIAGCLIEIGMNETVELHSYSHSLKKDTGEFDEKHKSYAQTYRLPEEYM
jgi:phosphate:Na+ symporter